MTLLTLCIILLIFGTVFYLIGQFVSAPWKTVIQALCGLIMVVALLIYLFQLVGVR